jgi:hypothetical protein
MRRSPSIKPLSLRVMVSLLVVAALPMGFSARASEQITIETLLSWNATSFQRHLVTVEGVVSAMIALPPTANIRCRVLYGRAAFMIDDETGILPIEVLGNCNPNAYDELPQDGDRVRVTGIVEVMSTTRHVKSEFKR